MAGTKDVTDRIDFPELLAGSLESCVEHQRAVLDSLRALRRTLGHSPSASRAHPSSPVDVLQNDKGLHSRRDYDYFADLEANLQAIRDQQTPGHRPN